MGPFFDLPSKQKIGVKKKVRESEIGEEGRQFLGVNFGGGGWGPEILEKQGRKNRGKKVRHQNSLRNSPAIFLNFAGPN